MRYPTAILASAAFLAGCTAVLASQAALAGVASPVVTGHELKLSLKGATQGTKGEDAEKQLNTRLKDKDVLEICLEDPKQSSLVIAFECADIRENEIRILQNDPITSLQSIGYIFIDDSLEVRTTDKSGDSLKTSEHWGVTILLCEDESEGELLFVQVYGTLVVKYKDLDGEDCPNSVAFEPAGFAEVGDSDLSIVTSGSIKASNRKAELGFDPEWEAP